MALTPIRITGVLKYADNTLARGVWVKYRPRETFGSGGELVPPVDRQFYTDRTTGVYDFNALTTDVADGHVGYDFDIPVNEHTVVTQPVDLTDDLPETSLDALVNAYNGTQSPSAAASILELTARVEALEAGGGGGGGSETATTLGVLVHGSANKATPVDADEVAVFDSAASFITKRSTFTQIKAFLKTYWDTLYQPLSAVLTATTASFTTAKDTKLSGIATGATANSADAVLLDRANHTGTESADVLTDGTTNKAFLATERTKLAGIAAGATANSSDATLLARANHTGTQLAVTISDFNAAALSAAPAETASTLGATVNGSAAATPNNTDLVATVESSVVKKITWTNVKAFLKTYFDTLYPSGSGTSSGTNTGDQTISLTGDVTGSGTGSFATTIGAAKVTLAMQANMATASVVYRKTAGSGAPEVNTLATLKTDLGLTGTNSGDQTLPTAASTTEVLTGTDAAKFATPDAVAALWEQGANIASAGTLVVGEGGYFHVTGTTTITDIDPATDKAGREFDLVFDGILTLTHNASTLILPTGANITTAAGDTARFRSEGSDIVRCVNYTRASGAALTSSGGSSFDPGSSLSIYDDFISGGSVTSGSVGALGWGIQNSATISMIANIAGRPGIVDIATGASAGNLAKSMSLHTQPLSGPLFKPAETFDMTWSFRVTVTDSNTLVNVGMLADSSGNISAVFTTHITIEKRSADTNWFFVTHDGTTATRTDSGVTVAANTWVKVRMRRIDASTIGFTINGGTEITHTTNIPTAALLPAACIGNNNNASSKTVQVDYFYLTITGLSR